jgi:hypothetical protein
VSLELLELAAQALDPVLDEVVFLGGASITLWITDPGAPPPLPTKDVDVVLVDVTTLSAFYAFEERLRSLGFEEDRDAGIICRFRQLDSDLSLDAMPAEPSILGFENRWQAASIPHAVERELPSGARIRAASPPYLLATKVEAFKSRGRSAFLTSRDFADIIVLIDGREELVAEVLEAPNELRAYLAQELASLMEEPRFLDGVFAALRGDTASQARAESVVMPRLRKICAAPGA